MVKADTDVKCQTCGVFPGEPCITADGYALEDAHVARHYLARDGHVTCPTCLADPGEPCVSRNGNANVHAHVARLRAAQEAEMEARG